MKQSVRRVLREPFFLLFVVALFAFTGFSIIFGTHPRGGDDSHFYVDFAKHNWGDMLNQIAGVGYGLFLEAVRMISPTLAGLPQIQFLFFASTVLAFFYCLRTYGCSGWLSFAASAPLLFSGILWRQGAEIMSDTPGLALALLTLALTLYVVSRPHNLVGWIAFGCTLFLTYQFRMALFWMVPVVPLMVLVTGRLRSYWAMDRPSLLRLTSQAAAVAFLPFLAFCLLRFMVAGHIGPVAMVAHPLTGISLEYLSPDIVSKLDKDLQPFALRIVEEKERLELNRSPGEFSIVTNPDNFMRHYNGLLLFAFREAVLNMLEHMNAGPHETGHDPSLAGKMSVEDLSRRLSYNMLKARPLTIVLHVGVNYLHGVGRALWLEPVAQILLIVLFVIHIVSSCFSPGGDTRFATNTWIQDVSGFTVVLFLGVLFLLVKTAVVVVCGPAFPRYMRAASVLLPAVIGAAIYLRLAVGR